MPKQRKPRQSQHKPRQAPRDLYLNATENINTYYGNQARPVITFAPFVGDVTLG